MSLGQKTNMWFVLTHISNNTYWQLYLSVDRWSKGGSFFF